MNLTSLLQLYLLSSCNMTVILITCNKWQCSSISKLVKLFLILSGDFNVLTLYIHLHRRFEFYLTHNYIPAILIVIISWLSLWIDRECAPARVGMGIATILTMTTLLIGTSQQGLPVVSYIKALDWYYIGCFSFVFVGLCEYSMVNYFSTKRSRFLQQQRLKAAFSTLEKVRKVVCASHPIGI